MPGSLRYHLDQDGHAVTVMCDPRRDRAEVWVDGKTVAAAGLGEPLRAEIPTDPPRPFTVRIERAPEPGGFPLCVLDTGGDRYLMPYTPLTGRPYRPAGRTPPARTPAELLARWTTRLRRP